MLVLETHVDKHLASRSSAGRSLTSLLFAVLMLAPGPSAEADWLVMRDGSRLETQGSWEVRGTRIVLTLPGGMLASVAMREVDLERSHGESAPLPAAAKSPRVEGSLPVRKPAFVLTNRDVPSARNVAHRPDVRRAGAEVQVEFWAAFKAHRIGGVEIRGILRNPSAETVKLSWVDVKIADSRGRVRSQRAFPRDPLLQATDSTSFLARFPDLGGEHMDPTFTIVAGAPDASPPRLSGGVED